MGGNALKNIETIRLNSEEYFSITESILHKLRNLFPERKINYIESYRQKESFGDLDILISGCIFPDIKNFIYKHFGNTEVFINSNIVSFGFLIDPLTKKYFQIDLIFVREDIYNFSLNYFSFNDLGNLIGRITNRFNFSFGWDGLNYKVYNGVKFIDKVNLSLDFEQTLTLFDFDVSAFKQGFETLEDVFYFVSKSKYFKPEIYILSNRNAEDRKRDKKRKTYVLFLEWLEQNRDKFNNVEQPILDEQSILKHFDKLETVQKIIEKDNFNNKVNSKYNGNNFKSTTKLEGIELGKFISLFKNSFASLDDYNTFILEKDLPFINKTVISFLHSQKQ